MTSNLERSACLCHASAGIKDVNYHAWPEHANTTLTVAIKGLHPQPAFGHKLLKSKTKQNRMGLMISGSGEHQVAAM